MIVSEIRMEDIEEIKGLQPEGWPDIIPIIDFYIKASFCKPIKISSNGWIVGIGAAIFHSESAWLGHIIVHKDFRNRGIGALITKSLVDSIDLSRYPAISLIATDMGEPVYKKLGFQKVGEQHFYRRDEPLVNTAISENIKDGHPNYIKDILALDASASGEDRYLLLKEHLSHAKVSLHEGKVKGFYLPSLGEGLIVAKNNNAGIELLKLSLSTKTTCVLPEENQAAISYLKSEGFKHIKNGTRMALGRTLQFRPQMFFSRIAGNVG